MPEEIIAESFRHQGMKYMHFRIYIEKTKKQTLLKNDPLAYSSVPQVKTSYPYIKPTILMIKYNNPSAILFKAGKKD